MTVRGTVLLVGSLGALAGYLWVVELGPLRAAPPATREAAPLLPVPPAAVARVELAEGVRRTTALRAEHGWTDAAGRAWPDGAVTDLIAAVGTVRALTPVP